MKRELILLALVAGDASAQVLVEDFSSLLVTENVVAQGAPLLCSNGIPANNLTFAPSNWVNKWGFHSSGAYPISWSGFNATQSWAVGGNQMYFRAVKGPLDDGHAMLSRDTFDRGKYIIASADIRAYCSNGAAGCWAGLSLISQESNYRGLYLATQSGSNVAVHRLAPCNEQSAQQAFVANSWQRLAVEYRGAEGGGWSYYLNGDRIPTTVPINPAVGPNAVIYGTEQGALGNTDILLASNPRLGIYTNSNLYGGFVEGGIANVRVQTLSRLTSVGATASTSHYPAAQAIDGNLASFWVANTGGPQWIELDLGQVTTIRKLRLLTEQSGGSYETVHQILVGTSPAPTGLFFTFSGVTTTGQWLDHTFVESAPVGRYVRIQTPTSQSWRAWREVEVYH